MEGKDLSKRIGARIAERRSARGLTLEDVASRTGVSRAMISRVERGEVHASAVVLDRLCGGLGLSLSALFAQTSASPLLRRADQPVWQDPGSGYIRREVAPQGPGSNTRIVEVEFPAGAEVTFARSPDRLIDQHVWVLAGCIDVIMGETVYSLSHGDCLHMRLLEDNSFRNTSGKPARYAVILTLEPIA